MERAALLARCSDEPGRLTRLYGTPAHASASGTLAGWMRAAGMTVRRDAIGNVVGRLEGDRPDAPALMLGSHFDTVRDAGRWDGTLGVLVAIGVAERMSAAGRRPVVPVEVVAFADEEGTRFGTAFLGSAVLAGRFDVADLRRVDTAGITLGEAIGEYGGDLGRLDAAARAPGSLAGYVEVHIEQGPVLDESDVALGVVTAIAGQTRALLRFSGAAGHAGTVPMELRHDALGAAAEVVLAAEALARETPSLVATVGQLTVEPGASNVIPGSAQLSLDVRHPDDATRAATVRTLREQAALAGEARGVGVEWEELLEQPAVACDAELSERMVRAVEVAGLHPARLASGAGHDAAVMAAIAPVAILFVRSAGGVSHHPDESVTEADVALAVDALARFVEDFAP
jgi:allantoate deiminase